MKKINVFFIIIVIGALTLPFWLTTRSVSLKESLNLTDIGQLLGALFVIALFLERALDVFLTTWRAQKSEQKDLAIQELVQRIDELKAQPETCRPENEEELNKLATTLQQKKQEKLRYRSKTRFIALWTGLFFGILISAVGIRTLGSLVDTANMPSGQMGLFNILDVWLTGGLIAGGSESLHKLIEIYRNFVDATSKKVKE